MKIVIKLLPIIHEKLTRCTQIKTSSSACMLFRTSDLLHTPFGVDFWHDFIYLSYHPPPVDGGDERAAKAASEGDGCAEDGRSDLIF